MKNSSDDCYCEFHKNNEIFSDAIDISWDLLRKNKFCFDTSDERVSRTSAYLGVEIFEAIKKIREKFMNESMYVDDQKVLVTLEEQQKAAIIKTSGSELDIIESNDDNISNDFAYSIDEDEEVFKQSEIDSDELKNDNFDSEIINHVENHNKLKEIKEEEEDEMSEDDIQNESMGIDHQQMSEEEEISEDDIQIESMGIDQQQVSETLEKHQKSSVIEISDSESDVTEMNDDQMSNSFTYSLRHDEEVEEYPTMEEEEPWEEIVQPDEHQSKLNNMCTSSAVNLSEQNTQQFTTGGVKRKLMDNDSSLSTTQNKRLYVVETSTSVGINQQPGSRCTGITNNYGWEGKTLDSKLQNDSHQSENVRKPTACFLQINNITADYKTQAFHEKVRDILNKLTQANIDGSTQLIKSLSINSHEKLKCVVDLVFEKAIDEPNFAAVCAELCEKLCNQQFVNDTKQNNNKKQKKDLMKFQALLLARCENEFESATVNEVARRNKLKEIEKCNDMKKKLELTALLNDADHLSCRKSVHYYKFIGELFNGNLLGKVFLEKCAFYLLTETDERKIDCLCELLRTASKKLKKSRARLNWYFLKISSLTCNEKLSSRVRYMLQEVIDLRARQWEPIRDENNTIKHVNEERAPSKKDDKNIEGVLKMKATNNDSSLPTEINKQPYAIATSTREHQQTSIQLPGYSCSYSYRNFY